MLLLILQNKLFLWLEEESKLCKYTNSDVLTPAFLVTGI